MKTSEERVEALVYLAERTLGYLKKYGPEDSYFSGHTNCFIDLIREIQIELSLENDLESDS